MQRCLSSHVSSKFDEYDRRSRLVEPTDMNQCLLGGRTYSNALYKEMLPVSTQNGEHHLFHENYPLQLRLSVSLISIRPATMSSPRGVQTRHERIASVRDGCTKQRQTPPARSEFESVTMRCRQRSVVFVRTTDQDGICILAP